MKKIFPPLAFAMFSSNLGIGIVSPLLSVYAKSMGASSVWIGLVMSSYGMATIISTPLFGRISDRSGRKVFLCIGLMAYALVSLGYIFSNNIPSLCIVRFLHGAAGGMVLPIASAYIGDISPKGEEGKWMGYASAAFFGGFGIGPLLGGVMSQYIGMAFTFSFMAGLNVLAFLIVLIFLPEVKSRRSRESEPGASFKEIFQNRIIKGLFFFQIAGAMCQSTFTAFVPIVATSKGLSLTLVGIIVSCTMTCMSMLGMATGRLADKSNKRLVVTIGSTLIIFAMFTLSNVNTFWLILALGLTMALGAGIGNPCISALAVREGRKYGMGTTMGVVNMGMNMGFAIGPVLSGKVGDLGQINYAFYLAASLLIVGVIVFLVFTAGQRKETPETGLSTR